MYFLCNMPMTRCEVLKQYTHIHIIFFNEESILIMNDEIW